MFFLFKGKLIDLEGVGSKAFGKSLNSSILKEDVKIPVPPLDVQQQIIAECEKIDNEYNTIRMSIESYRKKIEELFNELDVISVGGGYRLNLDDTDKFDISIGKRVLNKQLMSYGTVAVYSANVMEPFGYTDELLITDFSVPSVLWGIDGDWMTNYMPENIAFYPTDHCGVLRCKTLEVNPRYLKHILQIEGKRVGFSRSYRASIDRVRGLSFGVPKRETQDEVVSNVMAFETLIKNAEAELKCYRGKLENVLNTYLN